MWLIANDGERALGGKGSTGNCGTSKCTGAVQWCVLECYKILIVVLRLPLNHSKEPVSWLTILRFASILTLLIAVEVHHNRNS